jgi:hypothetical protein
LFFAKRVSRVSVDLRAMSSDSQFGDLDNPTSEPASTDAEHSEGKTDTSQSDKSFVSILRSNPLYDDVSNVFHWRDPLRSSLLFGIFNLFYLLTTWGGYSVLTLVNYLLLALVLVCFSYVNFVVLKAQWVHGKPAENPFKERFKNAQFHVSKESAEQHMKTVLDLVNLAIDKFKVVLYCTNNLLTLQFAFFLYLIATVGAWFSGATLFYLVLLGFFVWPRLYEEKQKEIDQLYSLVMTQVNNYFQLALSKIPPSVTSKLPFLKPKNT